MMASDPSSGAALRHRPFVLFWCARVAADLALQIQVVAVGWQVYALTDSPLSLGLVGLAQFVPALALLLFAGHVADRHDRATVARISQFAEAAALAVLALATGRGAVRGELILTMVFVIGAARSFEAPAIQALLAAIVPSGLFPRAVAASTAGVQAARIVGPALGGLLYAVDPVVAYAAGAALFLIAGVVMGFVGSRRAQPRAGIGFDLTVLLAGIAYIRRQPVILGAITLDLFAVLLGGAVALLPIYARDIFAAGPWGLGLLRLAPAVGALLTSFALARWPIERRAGAVMLVAVTVFGVATMVFAVSTSLALSLAVLAILGAADLVSVVVRQMLIQLGTPDAMRGRVSAVNALFVGTSNQLGQFESGVTAAWFGTVPAVLIGGIGTVLVVLVALKVFPELRAADTLTAAAGDGAKKAR